MVSQLRESSDILTSSSALKARLSDDGYLYFKRFFNAADIDALHKDITSLFEEKGFPTQGLTEASPLATQGTDRFNTLYSEIQALDSFHRLSHVSKHRELLKNIFGSDVFVQPRKFCRIIYPLFLAPKSRTEAHQDYRYVQGEIDTLTNWIPLSDCPIELGGLKVIVGSHKKGLLPFLKKDDTPLSIVSDVAEDDPLWATANYEKGDFILFHSLTVHAAQPNNDKKIRFSVDFRFQSVHSPLSDSALLAPYHCPTEINNADPKSWSLDPYSDFPDDLRIIKSLPFDQDLPVPSSNFIRVT